MLISTVEHNSKAALLSLVKEINSQQAAAWGLVSIKRPYLKNFTNDEIILAIKPALQELSKAKIFFVGTETIYVTWFGKPRQTYQHLAALIYHSLLRPEITEMPENIVTYLDPLVMGDELSILLKTQTQKIGIDSTKSDKEGKAALSELANEIMAEENELIIMPAQVDKYQRMLEKKPTRRRLSILIIEDQYFLRKLLSEVFGLTYDIDTAPSLKMGWELYIEKVPDIVFLDIQLADGNGHALAHKIKEIDPSSYIVMVTASNQRHDVELAKRNHVDGFVIKPFNGKKISASIDHYMATHKTPPNQKRAGTP